MSLDEIGFKWFLEYIGCENVECDMGLFTWEYEGVRHYLYGGGDSDGGGWIKFSKSEEG